MVLISFSHRVAKLTSEGLKMTRTASVWPVLPEQTSLYVGWTPPYPIGLPCVYPTQVAMTPGSRWKCSSVPPAVRVRVEQPQCWDGAARCEHSLWV